MPSRLTAVVSIGAFALGICAQELERPGSLSGKIITSDGLPLASAKVTYLRLAPLNPSAPRMTGTTTGNDGSFTLSNLLSGTYTICVPPPGNAQWLDPCLWSDNPVAISLKPEQNLTGQTVQVAKAATLELRVSDTSGILAANETKSNGGPVIPGVWTNRRIFLPAGAVSNTAGVRSFQVPVPTGVPLKIGVLSGSYQLLDDLGTPVKAGVLKDGLVVPSGTTKSTVGVTVTGLTPVAVGAK